MKEDKIQQLLREVQSLVSCFKSAIAIVLNFFLKVETNKNFNFFLTRER